MPLDWFGFPHLVGQWLSSNTNAAAGLVASYTNPVTGQSNLSNGHAHFCNDGHIHLYTNSCAHFYIDGFTHPDVR